MCDTPPPGDASLLPIARSFSWYALVHPDQASYENTIIPLGTCNTLVEFCQFLNHVPMPGRQVFDGRHAWRIASKHWAYGICFFEAAIQPKWEDPGNAAGIDLVCRRSFHGAVLANVWQRLLLLFINGELEEATGARITFKQDRRGALIHKVEVWSRRVAEAPALVQRLKAKLNGLDFVCMPRRL